MVFKQMTKCLEVLSASSILYFQVLTFPFVRSNTFPLCQSFPVTICTQREVLGVMCNERKHLLQLIIFNANIPVILSNWWKPLEEHLCPVSYYSGSNWGYKEQRQTLFVSCNSTQSEFIPKLFSWPVANQIWFWFLSRLICIWKMFHLNISPLWKPWCVVFPNQSSTFHTCKQGKCF